MAWTVQGNLKGPQGPQGPKGDKGDDGAGVAIAGSVETYGDLPAGLGPGDAGDGYLVEADGRLYVWSGTAFPANGAGVEFRGPQGPEGPQGPQGPKGDTGAKGDTGNTGVAGADATVEVGTVTTGAAGSGAAVTNTGTPGAAVLNFTIPRGDKGDAGTNGTDGSRWFFGTGAPGAVPGSKVGDAYLDMADGTVYQLA